MKYQNIENFPNIDSWKIIDNNCFFVSDDVVKVTGKERLTSLFLFLIGELILTLLFLMYLLIGVSILFLIIKEKL